MSKFNGTSDKITIALPTTGSTWTMGCWCNANATQNTSNNFVLSLGLASANGAQIFVQQTSLNLATNFPGTGTVTWGKALVAGAWTHVLQTNAPASNAYYVNGAQVLTSSDNEVTPTGHFVIGDWDTGTEFFAGLISDVAIWNTVLTAPEIRALGQGILRPGQVRPSNLIGWWALDVLGGALGGAGGVARDLSVFNRFGTLSGTSTAPDPPAISDRAINLLPNLQVSIPWTSAAILHAQILL